MGIKARQMAAGLCAALVVACFAWTWQSLAAGQGLVLPLIVAMGFALVGGYLWNRAKDEAAH
jgi:predicted lysophospholipase L1 biosynthesis ABC-type transport system permease subunit